MNSIRPTLINNLDVLNTLGKLERRESPLVILVPYWLPVSIESGLQVLSTDERSTLARYQTEQRRRHFFLGRFCLRQLLSQELHKSPESVRIELGEFGKPTLSQERADCMRHFSISHSRDYTVIAMSHSGEIGVDIEFMDTTFDVTPVAETIMLPNDFALWQQIQDPSHQSASFFDRWTKHEAYLKLTGLGFNSRHADSRRAPDSAKLELPDQYAGAVAFWS